MNPGQLAELAASGDRRALARLVTAIETGDAQAIEAVSLVVPAHGPARRIGVTGPPGAGKSTLVGRMLTELRSRGLQAAVLAVDPSSPLTGGALLGDRIRMQEHVDDPGVYMRSMATRGHLGGLATAAKSVVELLSRSGFDYVIVETVGVGQSEVEVMGLVDMVILVLAPGWGDQIQADKAGVIEIADLVVVNKGDRQGADELRRALCENRGLSESEVMVTTATTGGGVAAVVDAIESGQSDSTA